MFINSIFDIYEKNKQKKQDLALNNQQWLIYHKIKPNQINLQ